MSSTPSPTLSPNDNSCLNAFNLAIGGNNNPLLQPITTYGTCLQNCYITGGSPTTCNSTTNACYSALQTDLNKLNNMNNSSTLSSASTAFNNCIARNNNIMTSSPQTISTISPISPTSPTSTTSTTSPTSPGLSIYVIIGIACTAFITVLLLGVVIYENYKKSANMIEELAIVPLSNIPHPPPSSSRSVPSVGSRGTKGKKKKNKSSR